jgi:uncharacterized protein
VAEVDGFGSSERLDGYSLTMPGVSDATSDRWAPFARSWTVLLTSYKRDGTAVQTPVNLAVEGDHAYFRSYDKAGKTKRIRNNPLLEVVPSSVRGKPRGQALRVRARLLEGNDDRHAAEVIDRKYPIFQERLIRLAHRMRRYRTMHYELTPSLD